MPRGRTSNGGRGHGRGRRGAERGRGRERGRERAEIVIKIYPQTSASASSTLISKGKFEDFMWQEAGIRVKHYHSDQGVFASKLFRDDCSTLNQEQTFSGAYAKHQSL